MFVNNAITGKRFVVLVNGEDTIRTLKTHITEELGVPAHNQHLTFNGSGLHNDRTLSACGIDPSKDEV
jgi:Ubiquitin family